MSDAPATENEDTQTSTLANESVNLEAMFDDDDDDEYSSQPTSSAVPAPQTYVVLIFRSLAVLTALTAPLRAAELRTRKSCESSTNDYFLSDISSNGSTTHRHPPTTLQIANSPLHCRTMPISVISHSLRPICMSHNTCNSGTLLTGD
jgi:hypothetical protein